MHLVSGQKKLQVTVSRSQHFSSFRFSSAAAALSLASFLSSPASLPLLSILFSTHIMEAGDYPDGAAAGGFVDALRRKKNGRRSLLTFSANSTASIENQCPSVSRSLARSLSLFLSLSHR